MKPFTILLAATQAAPLALLTVSPLEAQKAPEQQAKEVPKKAPPPVPQEYPLKLNPAQPEIVPSPPPPPVKMPAVPPSKVPAPPPPPPPPISAKAALCEKTIVSGAPERAIPTAAEAAKDQDAAWERAKSMNAVDHMGAYKPDYDFGNGRKGPALAIVRWDMVDKPARGNFSKVTMARPDPRASLIQTVKTDVDAFAKKFRVINCFKSGHDRAIIVSQNEVALYYNTDQFRLPELADDLRTTKATPSEIRSLRQLKTRDFVRALAIAEADNRARKPELTKFNDDYHEHSGTSEYKLTFLTPSHSKADLLFQKIKSLYDGEMNPRFSATDRNIFSIRLPLGLDVPQDKAHALITSICDTAAADNMPCIEMDYSLQPKHGPTVELTRKSEGSKSPPTPAPVAKKPATGNENSHERPAAYRRPMPAYRQTFALGNTAPQPTFILTSWDFVTSAPDGIVKIALDRPARSDLWDNLGEDVMQFGDRMTLSGLDDPPHYNALVVTPDKTILYFAPERPSDRPGQTLDGLAITPASPQEIAALKSLKLPDFVHGAVTMSEVASRYSMIERASDHGALYRLYLATQSASDADRIVGKIASRYGSKAYNIERNERGGVFTVDIDMATRTEGLEALLNDACAIAGAEGTPCISIDIRPSLYRAPTTGEKPLYPIETEGPTTVKGPLPQP